MAEAFSRDLHLGQVLLIDFLFGQNGPCAECETGPYVGLVGHVVLSPQPTLEGS